MVGCSSAQTFTEQQIELIGNSPDSGIMRLWKIDDPADTMLLRSKADSLTAGDLDSEIFPVLKARMLATVNDPSNPGVGIAAPQVGIGKQLVIVQRFDKEDEPFGFYVNPRIEVYGGTKAYGSEGCLSVPNRSEEVLRSTEIVVSYLDEESRKRVRETVDGFTAIIFQHEIDHLNGVLYIDRELGVK